MHDFPKLAAQVRGARALLGWSQSYLAEGISVRRVIVADFESCKREPQASTLSALITELRTERRRHRLYGNRCRVSGMAAATLRTDRVYNVKEARKETVVFKDGADEYLNKPK